LAKLEVRRHHEAGLALPRDLDTGLRSGLGFYAGVLVLSCRPAASDRESWGRPVIADVRAVRVRLQQSRIVQGDALRQAPQTGDKKQMPEHRLAESPPGHAGRNKYIAPEATGSGRCRKRRRRAEKDDIEQVFEENTASGFEFEQQFRTWSGGRLNNSCRAEELGTNFHEYTPEGWKN
jgi:hypothetical protein